jgi:hypothetical protein
MTERRIAARLHDQKVKQAERLVLTRARSYAKSLSGLALEEYRRAAITLHALEQTPKD